MASADLAGHVQHLLLCMCVLYSAVHGFVAHRKCSVHGSAYLPSKRASTIIPRHLYCTAQRGHWYGELSAYVVRSAAIMASDTDFCHLEARRRSSFLPR